jgi:hypothetical protein
MNKEPFVVLMAEDDEHDIVAFRLVFERRRPGGCHYQRYRVRNSL